MSNMHYYSSTCYQWVVGKSKDEVIKKQAEITGAEVLKMYKDDGGLTCLVCRVDLPITAHYSINHYIPETITSEDGTNTQRKGEPVPCSDFERVKIINSGGDYTPIT